MTGPRSLQPDSALTQALRRRRAVGAVLTLALAGTAVWAGAAGATPDPPPSTRPGEGIAPTYRPGRADLTRGSRATPSTSRPHPADRADRFVARLSRRARAPRVPLAGSLAAVALRNLGRGASAQSLPACGSRLPFGRGQATIHGINLPWIDGQYDHDLGINPQHPEWGTSYNSARTQALFADIHRMQANVARVWLFENLEGLRFDARGNVSGLDTTFLTDLDDLVRVAERNHVHLYLSLINGLASTKPTIITDPTAKSAYLDNAVGPLVSRYRGKPVVFAYEVGNELQENVGVAGITWTNLRSFMADTTTEIHALDPGRLVSSSIGWSSIAVGRAGGLGFDFYDFHVYQDTWDPSETGTPGYCSELHVDKPVIIGEYGQAGTITDDSLQNSVVNAYQAAAESHGFAGTIYWAYGGRGDNSGYSITRGDGTWRPAVYTFQNFGGTRIRTAARGHTPALLPRAPSKSS